VAIAPTRAKRPGADAPRIEPLQPGELDECPFCEGREDRTPPEVLALPAEGRAPNTPGWTVRVVPNLYPALERQEVVVHAPEHVRSFAELDDVQLETIAEAWRLRGQQARSEGFAYVQAIINEGRPAGASLPHSHSQLVWLREPPPEVVAERPYLREEGCVLCRLVGEQRDDRELLVASHGHVAMLAAPAGRAPYELLITGGHLPGRDFLPAALGLVRDGIRRLRELEGPIPWNAWFHDDSHPHVEVVPRLTVFAGLELGAGIYVNPLAPEKAAEAVRMAPLT
jgi:UDPglucose--hexose-1-phosphate uridylyltransferase